MLYGLCHLFYCRSNLGRRIESKNVVLILPTFLLEHWRNLQFRKLQIFFPLRAAVHIRTRFLLGNGAISYNGAKLKKVITCFLFAMQFSWLRREKRQGCCRGKGLENTFAWKALWLYFYGPVCSEDNFYSSRLIQNLFGTKCTGIISNSKIVLPFQIMSVLETIYNPIWLVWI